MNAAASVMEFDAPVNAVRPVPFAVEYVTLTKQEYI
jgi:hypothetical protein